MNTAADSTTLPPGILLSPVPASVMRAFTEATKTMGPQLELSRMMMERIFSSIPVIPPIPLELPQFNRVSSILSQISWLPKDLPQNLETSPAKAMRFFSLFGPSPKIPAANIKKRMRDRIELSRALRVKRFSHFELDEIKLQWFSGKKNREISVFRGNCFRRIQLERAEHKILVCLARKMHRDGIGKKSEVEWGWVGTQRLISLLVENPRNPEDARNYLRKTLSVLRTKFASAVLQMAGTVGDRRAIIEFRPDPVQKGGYYRLSIPPEKLIPPQG